MADSDDWADDNIFRVRDMIDGHEFRMAAIVVKRAYAEDEDFRRATIASALSAITELRGSHSDEEVAAVVCDRLFGGT